jgi:hypothetical protein
MLEIEQHRSGRYPARTFANARKADITAAFALDFNTGGEYLTKRAGGDKYVCVPLTALPADAARTVNTFRLTRHPYASLNIAGNGMETLARYIWTQDRANEWVYLTLKEIHARVPVAHVRSGGQTGIDLAAGVAAVALGIPCTLLLPNGLLQRDADGMDRPHTEEQIRAQVDEGAVRVAARPH